jgi:hypothetical protein
VYKVSIPLLLNKLTVYGSMIENVCAVLRDHGALKADVLRGYVLANPANGDIEAELLPYMLDVGLIEMVPAAGADDFPTYRLASTYVSTWPTRQNLLHGLRKMDGVNGMILDLHAYLIRRDEYAARWLDYKEVYPAYNRDNVARSGGEVAFNENKMRSWLRVMSYIGLIQPERSNTFVLVPRLDLVWGLWIAVQAELAGDGEWLLAEGIAYVQAEFCQVTSSPGRLHPGFADALLHLQQGGHLQLRSFGDAEMVSFAGQGRYSHVRVLDEFVVGD